MPRTSDLHKQYWRLPTKIREVYKESQIERIVFSSPMRVVVMFNDNSVVYWRISEKGWQIENTREVITGGWMEIVHQYLDGIICMDEMTGKLVILLGNVENAKCGYCNECFEGGPRCSHCGGL